MSRGVATLTSATMQPPRIAPRSLHLTKGGAAPRRGAGCCVLVGSLCSVCRPTRATVGLYGAGGAKYDPTE
jgi:hypothetical protein